MSGDDAPNEGRNPARKLTEWLKRFSDPLAIVTLLLFLATVALYSVNRDLVNDAREASERQLRAYVFLGPPRRPPAFEKGTLVSGEMSVKNAGQTPAYNLTRWVSVKLSDYPVPAEADVYVNTRNRKLAHTVLNPGVEVGLAFKQAAPLTADERDQIKAGTKALYIFGELRYIDAFKAHRVSKFRLEISKNTLLNDAPWGYANEGNCEDEYCVEE